MRWRLIAALLCLNLVLVQAADRERPGHDGIKAVKSELPKDFDPAPFLEETKAIGARLQRKQYPFGPVAHEYVLFEPEKPKEAGVKLPLVVFFHGLGDDALTHPQCLSFCLPRNQAKNPCYFVAPCIPGRADDCWMGSAQVPRKDKNDVNPNESKEARKKAMKEVPTEMQQSVMGMIEELLLAHPDIDPDRVYLTGLSSGGYGCYAFIHHYPHQFAAIVPISAGEADFAKLYIRYPQKIAVWSFYNRDEAADIQRGTEACLAAIEKLGGEARRTTLDSPKIGGHAAWEWAYAEPQLIPWLFAQKRAPAPAAWKRPW